MRWLVIVSALVFGAARAGIPQETAAPIGLTECAACHEEEATAFADGAHGRAMKRVSPSTLEHSCISCHGDAEAHVVDPSARNIRRVPDSGACAGCHRQAARQLAVQHPGHARHRVRCLSCHASGHGAAAAEWFLRDTPVMVCGGCHRLEKAAAELPYAHREGREPFACTECHSPHGARSIGRPTGLATAGPCAACHEEKARPRLFEHPPGSGGGCTSCHSAHGSPNPRMLIRRDGASLCIECHADISPSHDLTRARYRVCTSCHVAIHGSNRDAKLFDE